MGYFSYKHLKMELFPMSEQAMLMVNISSSIEVDPKYMENNAVINVESAISSIEGVNQIETRITGKSANISIYLNQNTDLKYAYLKLEEKLNSIKNSLPEEFTTTLFKGGMGQVDNQFMSIEVRGSGGVNRVRAITDKEILPKLENIDGIASVEVYGGQEKSLDIKVNSDICEALNITPASIASLISAGQQDRQFVGSVVKDSKIHFVNINSEYNNIEDLQNIVIKADGPILLKDIAEITFGEKEVESYSRVNGKEIVSVVLTKSSQENLIGLSGKTKKLINKLNNDLQFSDIHIVIQSNMADSMEDNIDQIINLAITGAMLAIFILWIFLRNFNIISIIAIAIPASIYSAFNFFYSYDISINSLTLVGLAMAIGMLLDNSVVVMENIYRLYSKGLDSKQACIQGTSEVWKSVIAATLTTTTVFLPFIFSEEPMVKLIGSHVGISIISTLVISLVVALMLIPMATHYFLKKSDKKNFINLKPLSFHNRIIQIYIAILKQSLRNPAKTIIGGGLLFFITIFICLAINIDSLKETKKGEFNVYVTMPPGSTLEQTDKTVNTFIESLENIKEKGDITTKIYAEEAQVVIKLKEDFKETKKRKIADIQEEIEKNFYIYPRASFSLEASQSAEKFRSAGGMNQPSRMLSMMGIGKEREKIIIKGHDFDKMTNLAENIKYFLEELDEISGARMNYSHSKPEAKINFDQQLMEIYGITPSKVSSELRSFNSEASTNSTFKDNANEYSITIKIEGEDKNKKTKNLEELKRLLIPGSNNATYKLKSFSKIYISEGKANINRLNQEKYIEVNYYIDKDLYEDRNLLEATRMNIDAIVEELELPSGIAVEVVHEENENNEFIFMIIIAFILIFMILASVFESVSIPFVLMFSIPLAAIGSFLGLIFTGNSLMNANTLIGFLILLGIVVNNGIILIDYTQILRRRGYSRERAIMCAGIARVRPIMITAITTIIAMLPLALGKMEYVSAIGAPFAITVIGGLSVSTLLTLIFIPTLYSSLEDALAWVKSLKSTIKAILWSLILISTYFIITEIDSAVFQLLYFFTVIIGFPACIWFIMISFRKANKHIITEDEPIEIEIRNLVKIYDRDNRFIKEWKSGQKIRERLGLAKTFKKRKDLEDVLWQTPLVSFLIYFTYFHIEHNFWIVLLSLLIWKMLYFLINNFYKYSINNRKINGFSLLSKVFKYIGIGVYWGLPLVNAIYLWKLNNNISLGIFIAIIYYLGITVQKTSDKILKENIKVDSINGQFGVLRRIFFKFVSSVPIIGKRKVPFKANKGISLSIKTGMFGLLGPNGAGKTTLMRTICGIFDQSYGKIFINGIDTQKKREELQGVIGYLPQEFGTYENLTSWEFLEYQALLKNIREPIRSSRITKVLKAVNMYENKDKKIGSFSGGMKQRIGIAQTLLHLPRILVVDEPTAGLDPRERIRFRNMLVELSKSRIVIFSTHIIEDIASSCNQVAVINKGELKYFGSPTNMTDIAQGHVWQFDIPEEEFNNISKDTMIVHHIKSGNNVRVRCLSKASPYQGAHNVSPLLEDSYLWLLKRSIN